MFIKHYAPNRCEPKIIIVKMAKKVGGQVGCETRIEVIVKIQKVGAGSGLGGCEPRIE